MITCKSKFSHRLFLIGAACLYAAMLLFSFKYEMNPYLWFDEAGQFWIAKGLNHDSAPCSPTGSIADVISNNRDYNLDPGGYGIILHFWSMLSNHYLWLRALSLIFFLLSSAIFIWLAHKWISNWSIAILIGMIPFIIPMFYHEAFELRAYSMEMLGTLLCVAAIENLRESISVRKLIVWSCVFSVFLFSRYSIIIVMFTTSCYILWQIFIKDYSSKEKILMALFFSMPMIISLSAIYFLTMRYQNPELSTLSYLPYISQKPRLIFHNSSLVHFFYLALIFWSFVMTKNYETRNKYRGLVFITLSTNFLFVVLSALGFHPWSADTTRCISMIVLVVLSFSAIFSEVIFHICSKAPKALFIILAFVALRFVVLYKGDYKLSRHRDNAYTEFLSVKDNLKDDEHRVYVDRWESPCIRYQFEYGLLGGCNLYPEQLTFEKKYKHGYNTSDNIPHMSLDEWYNKTQPNMNDLLEYDLLICPELYSYRNHDYDLWEAVDAGEKVFIKKTVE